MKHRAKPDPNKSIKAWIVRLAILGVVVALNRLDGGWTSKVNELFLAPTPLTHFAVVVGVFMIPVWVRPFSRRCWLVSLGLLAVSAVVVVFVLGSISQGLSFNGGGPSFAALFGVALLCGGGLLLFLIAVVKQLLTLFTKELPPGEDP